MTKVEPDWWKTLFDETYLATDARSVCDRHVTCKEVDFIEEVLCLKKTWPILDLCGGEGRHSLELSRRGFVDTTVVDYSETLIRLGMQNALSQGLNTVFLRKDARMTGLPDERFRVIIVMASSFGYFIDEQENERILREAYRLLMPRGSLLLDLPSKEYVTSTLTPRSWHEADGEILVCRRRTLEGDVIYGEEMVISKKKGLIRESTYCTRLYSSQKIAAMLGSTGFDSVEIKNDFVSHKTQEDHGLMSSRMVVIAGKG
jgi:D-alanine-D-alanine ligase